MNDLSSALGHKIWMGYCQDLDESPKEVARKLRKLLKDKGNE